MRNLTRSRHSRQPRTRQQRGSALILIMLAMIPMCGLLGLVVDLGIINYTRESAQAAAEAAALAAAQAAVEGANGSGGTYCGSPNLACHSPAMSCPSAASLNASLTGTLNKGCLYAQANGFTNGGLGGRQTVTMEDGVSSPAPTVPGVRVKYWVTARVFQNNPLAFAAVLGFQSETVGAQATAGVVGFPPPDCITALGPSGTTIIMNGSGLYNLNCGLGADSNSSSALLLNGTIGLSTTGLQLVGVPGYLTNGSNTITPLPPTKVSSVADPFNFPAQTPSGTTYTNMLVTGNATLNPGIYSGGLTLNGSGTVQFSPGTYFFVGGGLTVNGAFTLQNLNSGGVTFYGGPITFNGSNNATLTAPSSGPFQGMLFVDSSGNFETFNGSGSLNFTGALYFPNSNVTFNGSTSSTSQDMAIVANTLTLNGSVKISLDPTNPSSPSVPKAALID